MKTLKKSRNKVFAGVCGGLGEYFNIDPVIVRLIWVVLTLSILFFPGLIIYIVAALIIPGYDSIAEDSSVNFEKLKSANINENKSSKTAPHSDDEFNSYFSK
ncbi:MAG: PspC domain-containing protein [Treponema sp.]|nr:PspC domain-containing protein [Treponema sp.]